MSYQNEQSRWVRCPICHGRTRTKVLPSTTLVNFPLYCHRCKREIIVNIVELKMVVVAVNEQYTPK